MRIAYISYEFPPDTGKGGIGTYVQQVATAMARAGVDVHVFAGSNERSGSEYANGFKVHYTLCINVDDFKTKVINIFAEQEFALGFDIIESPEINGNAWEIKKAYPSIPMVVRLHAPGYLVEKLKKKYLPVVSKLRFVAGSIRRLKFDLGYWRPYNKKADPDYLFIQLADYISAPSEAMKAWVVSNWKIPANKIIVITNIFLPSQALLHITVAKKPLCKRILFFGRLNVLKGLVNATRVIKVILMKYPDWKFCAIGDDGPGPAGSASMRTWMAIQFKEVTEQVEFKNGMAYEELPAALSGCEIVLLPSLFESFSYTCAEAMAAGKAIIGSKNGGMADLLQNNKSGILVDPYDCKEIKAALEKLITDDSFRYDVSNCARQRIVQDLDATKTTLKFVNFYKEILQGHFEKN